MTAAKFETISTSFFSTAQECFDILKSKSEKRTEGVTEESGNKT